MQTLRFLVLLHWASGRRTAYCASAYDSDHATAVALATTQGDTTDVTSTEARYWPDYLGGPKAPKASGAAYKLRSREFVDRTLAEIGEADPRVDTISETATDYCEHCGATNEHASDCPTLAEPTIAGEGPGRPGHAEGRIAA